MSAIKTHANWRIPDILIAVLVAAGVAVLAVCGRALSEAGDGMAPLWLANVAVLAPLARFRSVDRPLALSGAAGGMLIANLASGDSVAVALMLALANLAEIVIGLGLFGRLANYALPLYARRNLAAFFVGPVMLAPVVSALIGGGYIALTAGVPFVPLALHWFAADALGMCVVGPLILSVGWTDCMQLVRRGRRVETIGLILGMTLAASALFCQVRYPALFPIFPIAAIVVFRLRLIGAAITNVVIALIGSIATLYELGPIALSFAHAGDRILYLQGLVATLALLSIAFASILAEREEMLQSLVEGERRFRRIAECAPIAIFGTDSLGRVDYGNERWFDLIGRREVGSWLELVAPESRADAESLWSVARSSDEPFASDLAMFRRSGASGWMSLAMSPECDAVGKVTNWVGTAVDIEGRHATERRLADSERQYRLLADHSNDMISRIDLDGIRRYVSSACKVILDYEPEELVGTSMLAGVHPDDRVRIDRLMKSSREGRVANPIACYRYRRRDGTFAWVETSFQLVQDEAGHPIEFIKTVRDIAERRRAELERESAIAKSEENYRLLEMAERIGGMGHVRVELAPRTVYWSDEAFRIHGRPIGTPPTRAEILLDYHPEDRALVTNSLDRAIGEGSPWSFCARLMRPDGELRHVESIGHAERAPDGTIIGLVGVFRDITDHIRAEASLVAARDAARASAEAKSAFLATMSHEIRTPMTGVLGMIELLREGSLSSYDRDRYFENLEQSATVLMTVLDDVLDFSKIETGNLRLESIDFDLAEAARNTLDLWQHPASKKGLLLSLSLPVGQDMAVHGDPVRLKQILSNLVSNAIKFTPAGKIELKIDLSAEGNNRRVSCEVIDTGVGIASNVQGRLFDPFEQADASTTRQFGGTGLGLAISKRLVEAMHGTIGVQSVEGEGSRFYFELVLEAGAKALAARQAHPRSAPGRALSILCAEDNLINRLLIEGLVRRDGHRICSVDNGLEAVAAAGGQAFDVILMDMQMPVMDGLAATRAIRDGSGPCASVPIIALTADASPERRRFYQNVGLTDFIAKPIDSELLRERLSLLAATGAGQVVPSALLSATPLLLDETRLASLEQTIGSASTCRLLELFEVELTTRPGRIANLIESNAIEAVAAEAHGLKGASLNVGAAYVGELASRIGEARGDREALNALGRELVAAAHATRTALNTLGNRGRVA